MPHFAVLGKIAAKNAINQQAGREIGQSGIRSPRIKNPIIQAARLFFSMPTSRSQVLQ